MAPDPTRRRSPRAATALLLAVLAVGALVGSACGPTPTGPPSQVTFHGHGFGHGRGMGQWGALGYAVDQGWSTEAILDHYYGGTATYREPTEAAQRVLLSGQVGQPLTVTHDRGRLRVDGGATDHAAVRITRIDDTRFAISSGPGCAGPWTHVATSTAPEVAVTTADPQTDDLATLPQLCRSGGTTYYRGALLAVHRPGTMWTLSRVGTEPYLRSVVAQEVSPSWADLGGGRGAAAVRAQAVAARSYARAGDTRWAGVATSCDDARCQAYPGVARRSSTGSLVREEDPRTDEAVRATAGQVRRFPSGRIAHTEFAASSGGWTMAGSFPAVEDLGDAYAGNPSHDWSRTFTREQVEAAFDRWYGRDLGTLNGIDVLSRNGLGADGGRVVSARARFSSGEVSLGGRTMASILSLRSDWWTPAAS